MLPVLSCCLCFSCLFNTKLTPANSCHERALQVRPVLLLLLLRRNLNDFVSDTWRGREKKIPYLQILIQWCFLHAPLLLCTFLVSCLLLYLIQHPHLKPPWHGHGDGRDTACVWDNHCQSRAAGEPRKHLIGKDSLWIRIIELDLYQCSTTCRDRSGQL